MAWRYPSGAGLLSCTDSSVTTKSNRSVMPTAASDLCTAGAMPDDTTAIGSLPWYWRATSTTCSNGSIRWIESMNMFMPSSCTRASVASSASGSAARTNLCTVRPTLVSNHSSAISKPARP